MVLFLENPASPEARRLFDRADAEMRQRYPQTSLHAFAPDEIAGGKGAFVVARVDGEAVGCGAVKPLAPGVGEIKKMFVEPEQRGRGFARAILAKLEAAALDLGFAVLRLETGTEQPESIALYESSGYVPIPKYGEYVHDPLSVCFEKRLSHSQNQRP